VGPNRLRALAVTSKARMAQMPDVPTAHEAGLPGFENVGWFGLFAPAGTPASVIQKVQRDVASVMAETEVKARLYVQGMSPAVNSTVEFTRQLDQELERWAKVVAARKLQAN
jgi:tripartite-type tricarboxylate transporter receptor subunit TctC